MFATTSQTSHEINPSVGTRNEDTRIYLLQLLRGILNICWRIEDAENHHVGGWFVSKIFDMSQIRVFHENTEYVYDCFESINVRSTLSFFCPNVLSEFAAGLENALKTFTKVEAIVTDAVGSFEPGQGTRTLVVQPARADPISYITPLDLPYNTATRKYILCWNLRAEIVAALKNQLLLLPEPQIPSHLGVDSGDCHTVNPPDQLETNIVTETFRPQDKDSIVSIPKLENMGPDNANEEIGNPSSICSEIISVSQVTSITPMDNASHWGMETIDGSLSGDIAREETVVIEKLEGWYPRNPLTLREEEKQQLYSIPQSESPNMETSGEESDFGDEGSRASTPPTPPCYDIPTEKKVPMLKENREVLATSISNLHLTEEEFELVMALRIVKSHGSTEVGKVLALLNRSGGWKGLERLLG